MEMFSTSDLKHFENQGVSVEKVNKHIEHFKKGFPFTEISKPCVINEGIYLIRDADFDSLIKKSDDAAFNSRTMKFVPASGAASRMFKTLNYFSSNFENVTDTNIKILAEQGDKEAKELYKFMQKIKNFAFFDDLRICMAKNGFDINSLIDSGEFKEIIDHLLNEKGLNYANLPKGLLKFHNYSDEVRTSIEEHLVEAAKYTKDKNNQAHIHFTVSPEHLTRIETHIKEVKPKYEKQFNVEYHITFSIQNPSTDTIAVDLENKPFYDDEGKILFRPAGHGALIQNLDDLKADIIFIKNIDNVVPDKLKETTYTYKKALAGYLITLQEKSFDYLNKLDNTEVDKDLIEEIFNFIQKELFIYIPQSIKNNQLKTQKEFAYNKLNRPIRVCGMVKNEGEPGGGPFWTRSVHGDSVQIVETSQIDLKSEAQKDLLSKATHFNPVDLVCGVKDYRGNNFNLEDYIDHNTGFISKKSKDGRDLKALELPGLWNGAMAYWNTVFIEVPSITFNPVKTVNDLLRPEHQ